MSATTAPSTDSASGGNNKFSVGVQKFGTFLSGMIMPNIPALIAWGLFTAFFIEKGWTPNASLSELVGPTIHYLMPLLIANTAGRMVYKERGGVVATVATMGVIVGSDYIVDQFNAALPEGASELGQVHMFIGAMIMAPIAAWLMKQLDKLWDGKIRAGFEMLVNLFSAGIFSFIMAIAGFYLLAPVVNGLMTALGNAVGWLINNGLLPLTSILIEPAKVFFLNNAINHGVLTPLGTQMASVDGKSILFLLEANPGPGLGILLAFSVFGVGMARASAPGAAIIHFLGGIHEIYFPYVLMKPALLLAVIAGGMSGVFTNMIFDSGLRAPAAPGSIIAVLLQTASDSYLGVILSVVISATVTFVIAAVILRASRKRDLEALERGEDGMSAAVAKTQRNKGKDSAALSSLAGQAAAGSLRDEVADPNREISSVVFACDAGMGSSAMGASVMRKKVKDAGITGVSVTNAAIANLDSSADLIITQEELTPRARQRRPDAIHVSVGQFMNSPKYDEVVNLLKQRQDGELAPAPAAAEPEASPYAPGEGADALAPAAAPAAATATAPTTPAADPDVLTLESITTAPTATTRDEAIREAGERLVARGSVTPDYVDAMFAREAEVSTFMGSFLAIPHGTNDAKQAVVASGLSVARYPQPIDWDGNEVRFVIGIAGKDGGHLEILAKIAQIFADQSQVDRLLAAQTDEELYELLSGVND
ncbi:PTS mannitol transporter subunit IICBA [Gulosibacter sp. ACHW.36C]|uniref:Mannitol-specific phosphotransferase enzyme IIA component n=1 Tax=Gulosibacter sediminis TaxID=1729695 RepID=A0ABY4MV67_9MICO|nr:PTS mannitol transporter subunit IICBA [Gulosibacter sediminis]UQN14311.1 PTS mannitol transporter subunit IICBA [Gulosibacter sediminis]